MTENSQTPTWPYIAIVGCLFLLSMLAPQAWRTDEGWVDRQAAEDPVSDAGPNAENVVDEPAPPHWTPVVVDIAPEERPRELDDLSAFTAPPQSARILPPVASKHSAPRIPEAPPLPVVEASARSQPAQAMRIASLPNPVEPVSPLRRQSLDATRYRKTVWPYPNSLLALLEGLMDHEYTKPWCDAVMADLEALHRIESLALPAVRDTLTRIEQRAAEAIALADQTNAPKMRSNLLRARYALHRRLIVWLAVHESARAASLTARLSDDEAWRPSVEALRNDLKELNAVGWEAFFDCAATAELAQAGEPDVEQMRTHARRVLRRCDSPKLTDRQQEFLQRPSIQNYLRLLGAWSSETVDLRYLLNELESYEENPTLKTAVRIAEVGDALRWSERDDHRRLAEHLTTYYRNANVRIALSEAFANRLLPVPDDVQEDVQGFVVGARVTGTSETSAVLKMILMPNSASWQMAVEASGVVLSETASTRGPVTTFQDGVAEYRVRKVLTVTPRGAVVTRAVAAADSRSDLVGLRTGFDSLPLLNLLARSIALQQYDSVRRNAQYEMDDMVADKVAGRFNVEIHNRLDFAGAKVEKTVMEPLKRLRLNPLATDMQTTAERLVARFRLAGNDQLAAFTPRPRAPQDSLLSVQVHESALNNAVGGSKLAGKRTRLDELYQQMSELIGHQVPFPENAPDNVVIQFADKEPVVVRCEDGLVHIRIAIAELHSGRKRWRDFGVHVTYRPDSTQLHANLVRDGIIELSGELGFRDRFPLRAIFTKVFSKSQSFNLINAQIASDPRLSDLQVTQFQIEDGWIGVALGPQQRVSQRIQMRR
ncbi:MAG: hypothetical protein QGG36_13035 [Pirellulaceae bacterium]|jgi:hypothetical protein|nr:hypothetical protein [Pirellulaceae bacterium]MDP7016721.1 hypothetical protein [Pirellulaceae bacterium]